MEDFDSPDQPADGLDERSVWVAQVRAPFETSGADASSSSTTIRRTVASSP